MEATLQHIRQKFWRIFWTLVNMVHIVYLGWFVLSNHTREYFMMSNKQLRCVFWLPANPSKRTRVRFEVQIFSEEPSQFWPAGLQEKVKEGTCWQTCVTVHLAHPQTQNTHTHPNCSVWPFREQEKLYTCGPCVYAWWSLLYTQLCAVGSVGRRVYSGARPTRGHRANSLARQEYAGHCVLTPNPSAPSD